MRVTCVLRQPIVLVKHVGLDPSRFGAALTIDDPALDAGAERLTPGEFFQPRRFFEREAQ
tara:strand:- start:1748 stop:1927 length:180 start_codon:yes stop_codon:yes gene_type:complete